MENSSACGLFDCEQCKFHRDGVCPGCLEGNLFLEKREREPCHIFACVRSQDVSSCTECSRSVCSLRGTTDTVCPLRAGIESKRHWAWRIAEHLESRGGPCHRATSVPLKTLIRLRWYLAELENFKEEGVKVVSSRELAERLGMGSAVVRKDFSCFGELGTPGLGYQVAHLQDRIGAVLNRSTCLLVWVGAQWLADALGVFASTAALNFRIVAVVDSRPEWIGRQVAEWKVLPLSELPTLMAESGVNGAVLALPEDAAHAADALVEAGVKGILNLTPVRLRTPPEVTVHHVDLLGEIMALALECSESEQ